MNNKNPILNWSWEKPTEEGLYLACRGDVETADNIVFIRASYDEHGRMTADENDGIKTYLDCWHSSFKFAKLCVGSEAEEVSNG